MVEEPKYLIEISDSKKRVITRTELAKLYEDAIRFDGILGFRLIKKTTGMQVKELKEKIKDLPDHMDVFLEYTSTEFDYSLANTAKVTKVHFREEPESETLSSIESLIISDQ